MSDSQNDSWGTTPPPADQSPDSATRDQGRQGRSRGALVAALVVAVVVVLVLLAAVLGGGDDDDVSDVPATDDNALPVEGAEGG